MMAFTILGFPIPQLQPLLPPPSKLPPSSEAGDMLGCLNDGVQIPGWVGGDWGGGWTYFLAQPYLPVAAGRLLDPSYLTLITWCCTDGGFQAP